jgi:hypothetical protein
MVPGGLWKKADQEMWPGAQAQEAAALNMVMTFGFQVTDPKTRRNGRSFNENSQHLPAALLITCFSARSEKRFPVHQCWVLLRGRL